MRRWTRAFGAALVLVGVTAGSAFAWPDRLDGHPIRPVNAYPGHEGYHPPAPSFRIDR
jgi:hypothetical protein